jgi:hypothetical protein
MGEYLPRDRHRFEEQAVAANGCLTPTGMLAVIGVTVIEFTVTLFTSTVRLPLFDAKASVIVTGHLEAQFPVNAFIKPAVTVAFVVSDDVQVA